MHAAALDAKMKNLVEESEKQKRDLEDFKNKEEEHSGQVEELEDQVNVIYIFEFLLWFSKLFWIFQNCKIKVLQEERDAMEQGLQVSFLEKSQLQEDLE